MNANYILINLIFFQNRFLIFPPILSSSSFSAPLKSCLSPFPLPGFKRMQLMGTMKWTTKGWFPNLLRKNDICWDWSSNNCVQPLGYVSLSQLLQPRLQFVLSSMGAFQSQRNPVLKNSSPKESWSVFSWGKTKPQAYVVHCSFCFCIIWRHIISFFHEFLPTLFVLLFLLFFLSLKFLDK